MSHEAVECRAHDWSDWSDKLPLSGVNGIPQEGMSLVFDHIRKDGDSSGLIHCLQLIDAGVRGMRRLSPCRELHVIGD